MTYEEFKKSVLGIDVIEFQFEDETQTVSIIIDGRVSSFVPYMKVVKSFAVALNVIEALEEMSGERHLPGTWDLLNDAIFNMLEV